jgi:hypothetical protein
MALSLLACVVESYFWNIFCRCQGTTGFSPWSHRSVLVLKYSSIVLPPLDFIVPSTFSTFVTSAKDKQTWSHESVVKSPTSMLPLETHISKSSLCNIFCRYQVASGFSAFISLISSQCTSTAIQLLSLFVQNYFSNIFCRCQVVGGLGNQLNQLLKAVPLHHRF